MSGVQSQTDNRESSTKRLSQRRSLVRGEVRCCKVERVPQRDGSCSIVDDLVWRIVLGGLGLDPVTVLS